MTHLAQLLLGIVLVGMVPATLAGAWWGLGKDETESRMREHYRYVHAGVPAPAPELPWWAVGAVVGLALWVVAGGSICAGVYQIALGLGLGVA